MQVIAKSKYVRQSPRKLRLVAGEVIGLKAKEAVVLLENLNKRSANPLLTTIKQGIGNAVNNFQLDENSLMIKTLEINKGPSYKRMDKAHRVFRWGTIEKKTAHIRLTLEGEKQEAKNSKKPMVQKKTEPNKKKFRLRKKNDKSDTEKERKKKK